MATLQSQHVLADSIIHMQSEAYPVEDNTRVEHKGGVKELLELPHEVIGLCTPLHLYKRRDIAPCAVLSL